MAEFRFSPRPNRAQEVLWLPWGSAAFQRAQQEDKPIVLSISAVWCHWCHVMDETTYSDPEVHQLIGQRFIPVRVDSDLRPDINQRYNMGGWPTVAFLMPSGDIITGGTYIPPQQFKAALVQVSDLYRQQKPTLFQRAESVKAKRQERAQKVVAGRKITPDLVDTAVRAVTSRYDPTYGGFGEQPKFPLSDALELLLQMFGATGELWYLLMVQKTLDRMQQGGLFDQGEGGFFRYATVRDWSLPHYEKMLEENASLLRLYLHAYAFTGVGSYRDTAARTIEYLSGNLWSPALGAFCGSQDADEEYYSLDLPGRSARPRPLVDPTVYASSNAQAAVAYLEAAMLMGRPELRATALTALETAWSRLKAGGEVGLYHCCQEGGPGVPGLLQDYAAFILALAEAYKHTAEGKYLERAETLAKEMTELFFDQAGGAFFDIRSAPQAEGSLQFREKPLPENVLAAEACYRLYLLTLKDAYRSTAEAALSALAQVFQEFGEFAAGYGRLAQQFLFRPLEVAIVGAPGATDTQALLGAAMAIPYPHKDLLLVDPGDQQTMAAKGYVPGAAAQAYLCLETACLPPISDPGRLTAAVEGFFRSRQQLGLFERSLPP
ncbi:MAG: thioredoxin domain-containing protein [Chloroflexi bacterium]|nr:thioredoxin domain-containing protein [Chloroflexota bacterium]